MRLVDASAPTALRFRPIRILKEAGGVTTVLAEDLAGGGGLVVIKRARLDAIGPAVAARLEHEATVLARLGGVVGPGLVGSGVEDGMFWMAQQYRPGDTLAQRLESGRLNVDEAIAVAVDVVAQIGHAHHSGVLHRDVKPANIVVAPGGERLTATLIDFGLARSAVLAPLVRDQAVGTARYASPEQAGLIDVAVDERSDLYSLGVVLFECLAGRPPFEGPDLGAVLQQHLRAPPPSLAALGVRVPKALGELVGRLLRKDPADRYQTADALSIDLELLAAARRAGIADPPVVVGRADRRATLTESAFVGRESELVQLTALLGATEAGNGRLAVVEGDSGSGKSRLLEELARVAIERGAWVLRGQAVDQAAQRPFQLLDGVAAGVVEAVAAQTELAARLRRRLGMHAAPVAAALPRLAEVLSATAETSLPAEHGETRSLAALAALLDAVSDDTVLVVLDDCQWAPDVAARIMAQWRRRRGRRRVMVVAAFRSEEVAGDSPLRTMQPDAWVTVGPLERDEVADLVASMGGQVPADAVATVHRLSEGSPFLAQAVLRGMVECGALVQTAGGWALDPLSHGEVQASRRAALFLARCIELLSPAALAVLQIGATLGKEFDLDLAVALSALPLGESVAGLQEATKRRILWVDESAGRARFLHDKLREAVLDRLGEGDRQVLHLRAARALQDHPYPSGAPEYDLAYHFAAAGHPEEALPYALAAAEQARARHALDIAEANYLIASRGAAEATVTARARVAEGLGDVLALRGHYAEAESQLAQALALTEERVARAALEGKLGDVAFRRGDQGQACVLLEGALRQLGHRVPRRALGFLLPVLWAVVVQAVHTLVPASVGRASRPATESETLSMRLHSRLAYVYWFRSGVLACAWSHLRGMNLAERFGPSPELAQAYSEHAPVMTMIPWYSRGITYAERSLAIRTGLGDVWGQGQSLHFYGVVLYAASRFRESLASCQEAIALLGRTGDQWEMNTATWHAAFAHYRLGELRQAVAISSQLHADACAIGDQTSAGIALSSWSRAGNGRIPDAVVAAALGQGNEDVHTASEVRLAESVRLLAESRPGDAVALLDAARREVRQARLRQEYVAPILPWLATALRSELECLSRVDRRRRALVARNRRASRAACRLARHYRNNLPHALREAALAAATAGRPRRARRLIEQSIRVAADQEAAYEQAQSLAVRGRLGLVLGWPGAREDLHRGRDQETAVTVPATTATAADGPGHEEFEPPTSLARTDRFGALVNAGREIAAATSATAVRRAVADAVPVVLRAERGWVVDVRGEQAEPGIGDDRADPRLRSLIRQAVDTGQVVTAAPDQAASVTDSLVFSGVRSALCAPISRGGRVVACILATHGDIGGVFGDEERRLAEFMAAVAGATLEHVAGSEAHFRALVRNSKDLTIVTDPDVRSLYVSPSITQMLGYTPAEYLALGPGQVTHPDDLERITTAVRLVQFSPAAHPTVEIRARHRNGSLRWLEMTLSNLLADSSIRGLVFNIRDVTDRKHAELALAQATEQFRLSFENAPIGMALTSIDPASAGQLLRVNQALADMLGYARPDLEGRSIAEITHPDDLAADTAAMARFQNTEASTFTTVKRYRHADGHWIWVQLRTTAVAADDGPRTYVISQILDLTERRAAEERLTFLALHDPLTGLANRRLLHDRLSNALARAERQGSQVAVLYIDLDGFKATNDAWGHDQGDELLVQVGGRLGDLVRESDTIARLGGDEFVLVADGLTGPDEAQVIACRIEASLSRPFALSVAGDVKIGASVGVALATGGTDANVVLRDADAAMYRVKEQRRRAR